MGQYSGTLQEWGEQKYNNMEKNLVTYYMWDKWERGEWKTKEFSGFIKALQML